MFVECQPRDPDLAQVTRVIVYAFINSMFYKAQQPFLWAEGFCDFARLKIILIIFF